MGRDATKAAGNPWYQARKKAAEYDDRLCSRESAAEQLGMSVSSLADAELGNTKFMPVDKAVLMADRYNAPWLLNHYCLNECPIGCRHSLSDEVVGIDRVTVKLLKSLKTEQLGEVKDTLLDIAADGKITEDEKPALQEVLTYGGISKRTLENAAIKGSAVHNSIENWIKFGIDDIPSEHRGYFNGFMEWWKQYKPRVFGSEVRIYHIWPNVITQEAATSPMCVAHTKPLPPSIRAVSWRPRSFSTIPSRRKTSEPLASALQSPPWMPRTATA